eukprot:3814578-Ditylum_brightwellii.AAC.1
MEESGMEMMIVGVWIKETGKEARKFLEDQIWRDELSKDKKSFVAAHSTKTRHDELTENLTIPKRFKRLSKERESQGQEGRDDEKIARRRLGFNLDGVMEDEKKEE